MNKYILLILLIIIIIFLTKNCLCKSSKYKEVFKELTNYNVSLCVPCIPRDKDKLIRLMKSVKSQTLKPYEVVISLSGEEYTNNNFKNKLESIAKIPVKIIYTKDKKIASENRNIASENASGDILSYIDADDIMKNNRIERIVRIFKKYNCNAVLHSFEYTLDTNKNSDTKIKIYEGKIMYKISKKVNTIHLWINNENPIHHGHISIKKNVFNNIKFNTSQKYRRSEDSKFVRDIIEYYGNNNKTIVFTNEKLSYYIPAASQK
jgi:glycosyltransferase involved in cell wall biosynthesis